MAGGAVKRPGLPGRGREEMLAAWTCSGVSPTGSPTSLGSSGGRSDDRQLVVRGSPSGRRGGSWWSKPPIGPVSSICREGPSSAASRCSRQPCANSPKKLACALPSRSSRGRSSSASPSSDGGSGVRSSLGGRWLGRRFGSMVARWSEPSGWHPRRRGTDAWCPAWLSISRGSPAPRRHPTAQTLTARDGRDEERRRTLNGQP